MKSIIRAHSLALFTCLILSAAASADVKIKSRQSRQGQSYESTTYIKGKRQRAEQNFDGMETATISQCDLRRNVRLMPSAKTYVIESYAQASDEASAAQTKPATAKTAASTQPESAPQKGGVIAPSIGMAAVGRTGSAAGSAAGQVAAAEALSASRVSANFKSKDELSLDVGVQRPGNTSSVVSRQFKAKARSDGEDLITPLVEQAARAVVETVGK